MNSFTIEPRDTLVAGDGRSHGTNTANRSLDVPWPTSVVGLLRTEAGKGSDGRFDKTQIERILALGLRGPVVCELDAEDRPVDWLLDTPADLLCFADGDGLVRRRLAPMALGEHERTNLPGELAHVILAGEPELRKPARTPRFMRWQAFQQWLLAPVDGAPAEAAAGVPGFEHERRVHVSVHPETGAVLDSALFETDHARYQRWDRSQPSSRAIRRFGLHVAFEGSLPDRRVVTLAGERRLSYLRKTSAEFPAIPVDLVASIASSRKARVILLGPAVFDGGFRPSAIAGATVTAAAVQRPWVISGWDVAASQPKASRRCAPPGSVYWVTLPAELDAERWVRDVWFQNVSSEARDRRDGLGLAAVGVA